MASIKCTLLLCLVIMLGLFHMLPQAHTQSVPCKSEVILTDYYGNTARQAQQEINYSSDSALKALTKISLSLWANKNAQLTLGLQAKLNSNDFTPIQLMSLQIKSGSIITIGSSIITSGAISMTMTADYGYIFVTFDVGTSSNQQICVFLIQSPTPYSSANKQCLTVTALLTNFSYEILQTEGIPAASIDPNAKTSTIYLHRDYGIDDITNNEETILRMLMRDDSSMQSYYLFNQNAIDDYLLDNSDDLSNNVMLSSSTYPSGSIPSLFNNGLKFSASQFVKFNGFSLSEYNREFSISMSIQTQIEMTFGKYVLLQLLDNEDQLLMMVELNNSDLYYDELIVTFPSSGASPSFLKTLSTCQVERYKWDTLMITGYSQPKVDSSASLTYFIAFTINSQLCETINYSDSKFDLSTDLLYLQLGSTSLQFQNFFIIKALRIYSGGYIPLQSGTCSTSCDISERRSLTIPEQTKIDYLKANPSGSFVSDESAINLLTVSSTSSLGCVQCSQYSYALHEYCLPVGSSCPQFLDPQTQSCIPAYLCSDPLHATTDCFSDCVAGFVIDSSSTCSVKCNYACITCDSTNPDKCLTVPSTRKLDQTQNYPCIDNTYFDDGFTRDCLLKSLIAQPSPGTISSIAFVFDVQYTVSGSKTISEMTQDSLVTPGSVVLNFKSGTDLTATPDSDEGIQFYTNNYITLESISQLYSLRMYLKVNGSLSRMIRLLQIYALPATSLLSANSIVLITLEQFNLQQYSIRVCYFKKCQQRSKSTLIITNLSWNVLSLSFNEDTEFFTINLFLGARLFQYRFTKYSSQSLLYTLPSVMGISIGHPQNKFNGLFDYFAVRYITLISPGTIYSLTQYIPNGSNAYCVLFQDGICLLCQNGYKLQSYSSTTCVVDTTTPDEFYYQALKIDHQCALNTKICTTCQTTPTTCKDCGTDRDPAKNCQCIDGKYSDVNDDCQPCSPKCSTCTDFTTCVTCATSRIGPPVCGCPSGYLELSTSACTPCDFSCASCDTATSTCKCPPVGTTFRKISNDQLTCPCLAGYYDPQAPTKICQKCFSNCQTCSGNTETDCLICKIAPSSVGKVKSILPLGSHAACQCIDSAQQYLDYNGECNKYVTLEITILTNANHMNPRIQLTLSSPIENSADSKWTSLLQISLVTSNGTKHQRILSDSSNLILTSSNDQINPYVGYIDINVQESCRVTSLEIFITTNLAVRSSTGVPLSSVYINRLFSYNVSPFILSLTDSIQSGMVNLKTQTENLQSSGLIAAGRYLSLFLIPLNCLQAIVPLLFVNAILPPNAHYLVTLFSSLVLPYTRPWLCYEEADLGYTDTLPPYQIYKSPVDTSLNSYFIVRQMGISASFLINLIESAVLILSVTIILFIFKFLDQSNQPGFKNKQYYTHLQSILIYTFEIRFVYILLAFFLQIESLSFTSGLGVVSSLAALIFLILFFYGLKELYRVLNSKVEKEEFQYRRVRHLVQFLDIEKHWIVLNYKLLQTAKKILIFFVLIFFQQYPKVVLVLEIIISILGLLLDIITRPFQLRWISYSRILSSMAYVSIWISVMIAYSSYSNMINADYIIESSTVDSFISAGSGIYVLLIIYVSVNFFIFILKSLAVAHSGYKYFRNRESKEVVLICEKIRNDGQHQQIQFALLNQQDLSSSTNSGASSIFAPNIAASKMADPLHPKERFLFNFRPTNLVKPPNFKKL